MRNNLTYLKFKVAVEKDKLTSEQIDLLSDDDICASSELTDEHIKSTGFVENMRNLAAYEIRQKEIKKDAADFTNTVLGGQYETEFGEQYDGETGRAFVKVWL